MTEAEIVCDAGPLIHLDELSSLDLLAGFLEHRLKTPVVDETNDGARYDFNLSFDAQDAASLVPAVEKQLGLRLERGRRSLEFAIIEEARAGVPKTP